MLFRFLVISIFLIGISHSKHTFIVQERIEVEEKTLKLIKECKVVNVYGMSGMGKTTLVNRLKRKLIKVGYNVVWINWDETSTEEQFLYHTTTKKNDNNTDKNNIIIVDNFNNENIAEIEKRLRKFCQKHRTKYIITSRTRINGTKNIEIPPFTKSESLSLMEKYFPQENKEKLEWISNSLGRYPYLISVVCQLANSSETMSIHRVEDILKSKPKDIILKNYSSEISEIELPYGNIPFLEMVQELKKCDIEAYQVLCFLSMLNSKAIPIQLIHAFVENEEVADAIIRKFSLLPIIAEIHKDDDFISYDIHEITQKLVIESIDEDDLDNIKGKLKKAFSLFYKKHYSKIKSLNREDQIFYNHLNSAIENNKAESWTLPLQILLIKRSIFSAANTPAVLKKIKYIESMNPNKIICDNDILFEYYIDWAFLNCLNMSGDEGKQKVGISYANKAIEIAEAEQNLEKIFRANVRMFWIILYSGDFKGGSKYFDSANNLLDQIDDVFLRKEFYFGAAWRFMENGEFKKSYDYANKGVSIDDASKSAIIGLYLRLFKADCEYRFGLLKESLMTIEEALHRENIEFQRRPSLFLGELLQQKAMVLMDSGNHDEAYQSITESIANFRKILKESPYIPLAVSKRILAEILCHKSYFKESELELNKSIEMFNSLIDGKVNYNFGLALFLKVRINLKLKQFDIAKNYIEEIISKFGSDHDITKKMIQLLVSEEKEWLLG